MRANKFLTLQVDPLTLRFSVVFSSIRCILTASATIRNIRYFSEKGLNNRLNSLLDQKSQEIKYITRQK